MKNTAKIFFIVLGLLTSFAEAATDTFLASGTWTAPAGVTSVTVEAWGGGGAGGGQNLSSDGGGGGGGGAYSMTTSIAVTPGNTYTVTVGVGGVGVASGTGGAGGDSYFIDATTVLAKGGAGGSPSTGTPPAGGTGGAAASGVGATKYSGGNGGTGRNSTNGRGGPGGSSAGTAANGVNGPSPWSTLTAAAAPTGGGRGGNGGDETGHDGYAPTSGNGGGGGGSGEGSAMSGGDGADGKVLISYTPCLPPSNIPGGVTVSCVCDNFGRANLNPSTIFGGTWALSHATTDSTGTNPYINGTSNLLRLTENSGNNAKAATVPSIFPAAGNYISVEFNHYAYNSTSSGGIGGGSGNTGADGVAVTLSDYSVPAVPGAYGGSLGYAQLNTTQPGFAGGWVGVGLDEYGNYQNTNEGRILGPNTNIYQSVGVRGPGSGTSGFRWMTGTGSNPGGFGISNAAATTPAPGYMYQVIVDARNSGTGTINVSVNRDVTTKNGNTYVSLLPTFNAYAEANYALGQGWISQIVPNFWKISFTGSTGGSNNIHEIGGLRICAQSIAPATGGSASGFSAIDSAYPGAPTVPAYANFYNGHIYTKLVGTAFNLYVAALTSTAIQTGYSASSNKYVQVKFVDNSAAAGNLCGTSSARTCNAACTSQAAVETGATQIAAFVSGSSTGVASPSPAFTLNSAYQNLVAVMKECTTSACTAFTGTATACSYDSFSVRPLSIATVTSSNATNTGTSGTPIFKAGSDNFSLTATTTGIAGYPSKYTGVMKINNAVVSAASLGTVSPATFGTPSCAPLSDCTPASTATDTTFTYSEVGSFNLPGFNPATDTTSLRGVYDGVDTAHECAPSPMTPAQVTACDALRAASWTGIDSVSTQADCVTDSYSNSQVSGKYGCNFGLISSATFGRFVPDHLDTVVSLVAGVPMPCPTGLTCPTSYSGFVYSGQSFVTQVTARNAGGAVTQNYDSAKTLSKNVTLSAWDALGSTTTQNPNSGSLTSNTIRSARFSAGVSSVTLTGTVGVTNGSATVIGTGTLFLAQLSAGDAINISGSDYTVSAISSDTSLTLTATYAAASGSGLAVYVNPVYTFATASPTDIYVRATDTDNVSSLRSALPATSVEGGGKVANGRIKVSNAYGSELMPLTLTATAQYYASSTAGWINSTTDNVTKLVLAASYPLVKNGVTTSNTTTPNPTGNILVVGGSKVITLSKPTGGGTGSATINPIVPSYLPLIPGLATFGVYKGGNNFIYRRENY